MQLVAAMVEVYDYDYDQYESSSPVVDPSDAPPEEYDETGTRNTWAVLTWIMLALTILLNLVLIGILVVKRNLRSITNKSESKYFSTTLVSCYKKRGRQGFSFCSIGLTSHLKRAAHLVRKQSFSSDNMCEHQRV